MHYKVYVTNIQIHRQTTVVEQHNIDHITSDLKVLKLTSMIFVLLLRRTANQNTASNV